MAENDVCFYVNSVGPEGRVSVCQKCMSDTLSTRTYIVKGGVGVVSDFIENVVSSVKKEGLQVQRFLNFLNPNLTDGAYFPETDTYLFDSNISQIDPPLIGACQYTVDLSEAENKKELYLSRALISKGMDEEKRYFEKAVRFLSTVKTVRHDTLKLSYDSVNAEKTERFVSRFIKKELGTFSTYTGREYFRFLGSVTPEGVHVPKGTIENLCPKIYCIEDKTDVCATLLISQIRESALMCGFDVISLLSPFKAEKSPEHIIVPELGLGVITSNKTHPYEGECFRKISSTRFIDTEKMKKHSMRIKFNLNAEKELLNQACFLLGEARKNREEYSEIYRRYTDISSVKSIADRVKGEILDSVMTPNYT